MRIFTLILSLLFVTGARGNLTNLTLEPFVGTAVVNTAAPRSLSTVVGNLYPMPVGPSQTNGQMGWSAEVRGASVPIFALTALTGGAITNGGFGAWYYIDSLFDTSSTVRLLWVDDQGVSDTNIDSQIVMTTSNTFNLVLYDTATQTNIGPVPLMQWFWLGLAWNHSAAFTNSVREIRAFIYTNGVFSQLGTNMYGSNNNWTFTYAGGGGWQSAASGYWIGRWGCPATFACAQDSDFAYPSNLIYAPSNNVSTTWYVSAATGNDTNTGLLGSPWLSESNMAAHMGLGGIFWTTNQVPGQGDTVIVDNTSPMIFGSNQLILNESNIKLQFTNGPILAHSIISPSSWSLVAGTTNTYTSTDGGSLDTSNCVMWEDGRWMYHQTNSLYSGVKTYVDTTAGAFFADGTNLYVHTFESSNPNGDGHVYTRSRFRGGAGGAATGAIIFGTGSNLWVDGLQASNNCECGMLDNGLTGGFIVEYSTTAGTNILSNFKGANWSQHCFGESVNGATNCCVIRTNCWYGAAAPYLPLSGGNSADVDHVVYGSGNSYFYYNITNYALIGVLGSTAVATNPVPVTFWTSHGTTNGAFYNYGLFNNVQTYGSIAEQGINSGYIQLTNCLIENGVFLCSYDAENCQTTSGMMTVESNGWGYSTNRNCIFNMNTSLYGYGGASSWGWIGGTNLYANCTFDLTSSTNAFNSASVFGRSSKNVLTVSNSVMLVNSGSSFTLLVYFSTNDTYVGASNILQFGVSNFVTKYYTNGGVATNYTLAQWQGLGNDLASIAPVNARIEPVTEYPYFDSVARIGYAVGQAKDYSGVTYANRNSCGAVQWRGKGNFTGFQ